MCSVLLPVTVLILVGILTIIRPVDLVNGYLTWGLAWPLDSGVKPKALLKHVTPRTARLYGALAIAFGAGLGALILLYAEKAQRTKNFLIAK